LVFTSTSIEPCRDRHECEDEPVSDFKGFPAATFRWFEGLEADNSRSYFSAHRETFDTDVRGAFEAMLEELVDTFEARSVKVFRQNRDLRFSPDKSPYKDRTYGIIGDRPAGASPLYAAISSAGLFAGSGYYQMARDQLERFRDAIAADRTGAALARVVDGVEASGLEVFGATLKTAPRGYPRDHPRIALLRHTSLIAGRQLEPTRRGIDRKAALGHVGGTWQASADMNSWLDRHVGPSTLEAQASPRSRRSSSSS
jgi:uncharacterized protein (TIGR02453 family)